MTIKCTRCGKKFTPVLFLGISGFVGEDSEVDEVGFIECPHCYCAFMRDLALSQKLEKAFTLHVVDGPDECPVCHKKLAGYEVAINAEMVAGQFPNGFWSADESLSFICPHSDCWADITDYYKFRFPFKSDWPVENVGTGREVK